jgi:hypothetical protein
MKQEFFAYLLISLAVLTLLHRVWRSMRGGGGACCSSGCSCASNSSDQSDRLGKRRELINLNIKATSETTPMKPESGNRHG